MARYALTDELWCQLQQIMKDKGCHFWGNERQIMEAILWKFRVGAPWRDIPEEMCCWQTAYNRFNRWSQNGLWEDFFLLYEAKLTRSGYSPMEVMSGLISMQVELGVVDRKQLAPHVEDALARYILPPMRMEIRSILKSLGVKCTTHRLQEH